ncbi:unnamed protein product [Adineta steineri]|uniref:F-box domain-containing protein n=1 Tax=Adineta steineri TaxID=433720 RepID=A0A814WXR6_9BILA|nr:unnamed protein product [Adineta steineri]CAF1508575.1 unnamed protein product [Adineta steineri]
MSNISIFECLPNELIIGIFDYLEPEDNFQSFFNCNIRLRKLVKQYVSYNRHELDKDITRFSTLHSWYKHLNFINGGVIFYLVPLKGEQERYEFDPRISDYNGIHWHFTEGKTMSLPDKRIKRISRKYPIKLNPIFATHGQGFSFFGKDSRDFIRHYYPSQFEFLTTTLFCELYMSMHKDYEYSEDIRTIRKSIIENERKRLRNVIRQAAHSIWKEIQALEDINILDIMYGQQTAGSVIRVSLNELDLLRYK